MDVHLLVYDLSRGMARQMSMGLLGFQLDAIYHTSILLQGREYVYDGGIISIAPGSSHLGQPMEKRHLGTTNLTMDIIEEYLDSVRSIFTLEVILLASIPNTGSADCSRRMICSAIIATISPTPSPISSWAKASRVTSPTCHKPSWTPR
jgi:hypothetical protein